MSNTEHPFTHKKNWSRIPLGIACHSCQGLYINNPESVDIRHWWVHSGGESCNHCNKTGRLPVPFSEVEE